MICLQGLLHWVIQKQTLNNSLMHFINVDFTKYKVKILEKKNIMFYCAIKLKHLPEWTKLC